MKKKLIVAAIAACSLFGMAGVAQAAPGWEIKDACGASFGALVSSAKSSGSAAHANYGGGAAAFADPAILAAHGCTG